MPEVTARLKSVEYWRLSSARMAAGDERPSWATDDDANGVTVATGVGSTLAVAVATTALYPQQTVQVEVAGIYEVRLDGARIEDIEPWLDDLMEGPQGVPFMHAAIDEAQLALLPYMREAVSTMIARTSVEVAALAPSSEHHSTFEFEIRSPEKKSRAKTK